MSLRDLHSMPLRSTIKPKKSLGQHFLTDLSVAQRIADTVDAVPGLPILEVGPGTGVLSQFLLRKGRPLVAVELDRRSVAYLHEHLPALQVLEADFLDLDLDAELFGPSRLAGRPQGSPLQAMESGRSGSSSFVLTGNYPYNISSQIFIKMLRHRDRIPLCTGMIQREVAERLAAPPGSRTYGVLSVFVQVWYDVQLLFLVPPSAFNPPPQVTSAVVSLRRNSRQELPCDEEAFRSVVKAVFSQRRKMLRGSLRQVLEGDKPSSDFFDEVLLTRRPETLSVDDLADLTLRVQAQRKARSQHEPTP